MVDWLGGGAFARYKLTESSSVPLSSLYLIVLFLHLYLTSNPSHLNSIGKGMICSREDEEKKKKKTAGKHLVVQRPPPQLKCASLLVTLSDKSDFDPQILNLRSFFWRFGADNRLKRSDSVSKCQKCPYQWKPCWLPALSVNSVGGWSVQNIRWQVVMIAMKVQWKLYGCHHMVCGISR